MSELKNCPLVPITELLECIVDNRGKSCPTSESGFPLIATNCIKNVSIYPVFENIRYVTDDVLKNWFRSELKSNDILFVNKGTPGRVCLVPNPVTFCVAQDMIGLRVNPSKVYFKYLFAVLRSSYIQEKISNFHVGIAIPHFKKSDLKNLLIPIPTMKIQQKIGELYCSISEKIELNNKIIAELEAIAKTLYDYWFLQFDFPDENGKPYRSSGGKMIYNEELKREIPEGWGVGKVKDLGDIIGGGTPSTVYSNYYTESNAGISWITPYDLANCNNKYINHGERDITKEGLKNSSAILMPRGSVLMTSRAPIGYLGISTKKLATNQGFKSVIPKEEFGSEFVYQVLLSMIPYFKSLGTGSTFAEISKTSMENVIILIPSLNLIKAFNNKVQSACMTIEIKEQENNELVSLRDFLLPMLMNGQVTFKDAEED